MTKCHKDIKSTQKHIHIHLIQLDRIVSESPIGEGGDEAELWQLRSQVSLERSKHENNNSNKPPPAKVTLGEVHVPKGILE